MNLKMEERMRWEARSYHVYAFSISWSKISTAQSDLQRLGVFQTCGGKQVANITGNKIGNMFRRGINDLKRAENIAERAERHGVEGRKRII